MKREEAIKLLGRFSDIETEICKQVNTARGLTKKAVREEREVLDQLFFALTGEFITEQDIENITGTTPERNKP